MAASSGNRIALGTIPNSSPPMNDPTSDPAAMTSANVRLRQMTCEAPMLFIGAEPGPGMTSAGPPPTPGCPPARCPLRTAGSASVSARPATPKATPPRRVTCPARAAPRASANGAALPCRGRTSRSIAAREGAGSSIPASLPSPLGRRVRGWRGGQVRWSEDSERRGRPRRPLGTRAQRVLTGRLAGAGPPWLSARNLPDRFQSSRSRNICPDYRLLT